MKESILPQVSDCQLIVLLGKVLAGNASVCKGIFGSSSSSSKKKWSQVKEAAAGISIFLSHN
jgi:hypothetical protein